MSDQAGSPPPNKPTLTKKRFLVRFKDGGEAGPMSAAELQSLAKSGKLGREDLVAVEAQKRWILAGEVVGLSFSDQACSTVIITPGAVADSVATRGKRDSGWFVGSAIVFAVAGLAAFGGWNQSELERVRGNSITPGIITAALYSALPITVAVGMWLLGTIRNRHAKSGSSAGRRGSVATHATGNSRAQTTMSSHSVGSGGSSKGSLDENASLEHCISQDAKATRARHAPVTEEVHVAAISPVSLMYEKYGCIDMGIGFLIAVVFWATHIPDLAELYDGLGLIGIPLVLMTAVGLDALAFWVLLATGCAAVRIPIPGIAGSLLYLAIFSILT